MNSRLGHIRPNLRKVVRYGQQLTWFVCYTDKSYGLNQLWFIRNIASKIKSWLGFRGTYLTAATAKKVAEKLEMRSSADLDLPKTLSATTDRIL
jgi:hypothetical protein